MAFENAFRADPDERPGFGSPELFFIAITASVITNGLLSATKNRFDWGGLSDSNMVTLKKARKALMVVSIGLMLSQILLRYPVLVANSRT